MFHPIGGDPPPFAHTNTPFAAPSLSQMDRRESVTQDSLSSSSSPSPSPSPAAPHLERPVSWTLGGETRLALFVPTDSSGRNAQGWPFSVYSLPSIRSIVEGISFRLYALLDATVSADEFSFQLQKSYLKAHCVGVDDTTFWALRESDPHRFWLVSYLKSWFAHYGSMSSVLPQTFVTVQDGPEGGDSALFKFRHAPFESAEFKASGKRVRQIEIVVKSHHLVGHIMATQARWDTLRIYPPPLQASSPGEDGEEADALPRPAPIEAPCLVLVRVTKDGVVRTLPAHMLHVYDVMRDQLPIVIDEFKPMVEKEKRDAAERKAASAKRNRDEAAQSATDGWFSSSSSSSAAAATGAAGKPVQLQQQQLKFQAPSVLTLAFDGSHVRCTPGILVSGACEVFGRAEFAPLDPSSHGIAHYLGTKGRFVEQPVLITPPQQQQDGSYWRIHMVHTTQVRTMGSSSHGSTSGADMRVCTPAALFAADAARKRPAPSPSPSLSAPSAKRARKLPAPDVAAPPPEPPVPSECVFDIPDSLLGPLGLL